MLPCDPQRPCLVPLNVSQGYTWFSPLAVLLDDLVLWALWGPSCWEFSTAAQGNLLQKEDWRAVATAEFPSSSPKGKNGNCLIVGLVGAWAAVSPWEGWCWWCSWWRWSHSHSHLFAAGLPHSVLHSPPAVLVPPVWDQQLMDTWNNILLFVGVFAFSDMCLLVKVSKPLTVPCLLWIWQSISSCKTLKLLLQDALLFGSDLTKYLWIISVHDCENSQIFH